MIVWLMFFHLNILIVLQLQLLKSSNRERHEAFISAVEYNTVCVTNGDRDKITVFHCSLLHCAGTPTSH